MTIALTDRMKSWIEGLGCHLCVASKTGVPMVTVARYCRIVGDGGTVAFALTQDEYATIGEQLSQNPWVAFGVSHAGSVRAAYQFKGIGKVATSGPDYDAIVAEAPDVIGAKPGAVLYVELKELYCTKPGHVAGKRLDVMTQDELCGFERDLKWKDMCPSC